MAIQDLWSFKYHPTTFKEMILTDQLRERLQNVIKNTPNITLAGSPGIGKGTFVEFYIKKNNFDVKRINGSMHTGIDMVRNEILSFATSAAENKLVYINEADRISPHAQDSLDALMEEVQDITRFILVCNEPNRIDDAIVSRCPIIHYDSPPIKLVAQRCIEILKKEKIKFETKDVINLVKQTGTDIRHTINTLQLNVFNGKLSSEIKVKSTSFAYEEVFKAMKSNDPGKVRKVLRSNPIDYTKLYEYLYELIMKSDNDDIFKNDAQAILIISEYFYRDNFVSIKEINFMGMYVKMIMEGIL
jgi:DNA polymerase III delta prime subunit